MAEKSFEDALADLVIGMGQHDTFHERLRMLAIEYQDKAITESRFAERTYAEIRAFFSGKPAASNTAAAAKASNSTPDI